MQAFDRNDIPWLAMLGHALSLAVVMGGLHMAGLSPGYNAETLLRFDALHYLGIMRDGYAHESSAFFPLFPGAWRLSGLGVVGIALINAAIYFLSARWLLRELGADVRAALVYATLPPVFFLFVPYTEAFFFLGSTGLLIALRRGRPGGIVAAMLWCTLSRPAFTALLPALLIAVALSDAPLRRRVAHMLLYTAACVVALLIVMAVQRAQTGDPWGFYKAQAEFGNTFKLPRLPLTSWGGGSVVRLDAVALLVGTISGVLLLRAMWMRRRGPLSLPPEVVLALGYVAGIAAVALLLRGGSLYSLNRFIMATPFALVLIAWYGLAPLRTTTRQAIGLFLAISVFFLLFGSFVHIRTFLWYSAVAVHLTLLAVALGRTDRMGRGLFIAWLLVALAIQAYYFHRYLGGAWVA